jgi:hypothetical protein
MPCFCPDNDNSLDSSSWRHPKLRVSSSTSRQSDSATSTPPNPRIYLYIEAKCTYHFSTDSRLFGDEGQTDEPGESTNSLKIGAQQPIFFASTSFTSTYSPSSYTCSPSLRSVSLDHRPPLLHFVNPFHCARSLASHHPQSPSNSSLKLQPRSQPSHSRPLHRHPFHEFGLQWTHGTFLHRLLRLRPRFRTAHRRRGSCQSSSQSLNAHF